MKEKRSPNISDYVEIKPLSVQTSSSHLDLEHVVKDMVSTRIDLSCRKPTSYQSIPYKVDLTESIW